jgi:hypothetical protein
MEAVMDKSVYSLSTIRMETRDLETKRVTCEGKLSLDIPDVGGAVGDIAYQVENTADGQLYVTISDGLQ